MSRPRGRSKTPPPPPGHFPALRRKYEVEMEAEGESPWGGVWATTVATPTQALADSASSLFGSLTEAADATADVLAGAVSFATEAVMASPAVPTKTTDATKFASSNKEATFRAEPSAVEEEALRSLNEEMSTAHLTSSSTGAPPNPVAAPEVFVDKSLGVQAPSNHKLSASGIEKDHANSYVESPSSLLSTENQSSAKSSASAPQPSAHQRTSSAVETPANQQTHSVPQPEVANQGSRIATPRVRLLTLDTKSNSHLKLSSPISKYSGSMEAQARTSLSPFPQEFNEFFGWSTADTPEHDAKSGKEMTSQEGDTTAEAIADRAWATREMLWGVDDTSGTTAAVQGELQEARSDMPDSVVQWWVQTQQRERSLWQQALQQQALQLQPEQMPASPSPMPSLSSSSLGEVHAALLAHSEKGVGGCGASRRRALWPLWSGGYALARAADQLSYEEFLRRGTAVSHGSNQHGNTDVEEQAWESVGAATELDNARETIAMDVARTGFGLAYYERGDGRLALTRILTAFAVLGVHQRLSNLHPAHASVGSKKSENYNGEKSNRSSNHTNDRTSIENSGDSSKHRHPGYVQGMNELAAVVLAVFTQGGGAASLHVNNNADHNDGDDDNTYRPAREQVTSLHDESAAFWTFSALVLGSLRGYFDEGLEALERDSELLSLLVKDGVFMGPSVAQTPEVTVTAAASDNNSLNVEDQTTTTTRAKAMGNTLAAKLAACDFEWNLITPGWFLTLYSDALPPAALLQLWDLVLWHGGNSDLRSSISSSSINKSGSSARVDSNAPTPPPAPARAVLLWAALKAIAASADTLLGDTSSDGSRSDIGRGDGNGKEPLSLMSSIEQLRAGAWASGLPSNSLPPTTALASAISASTVAGLGGMIGAQGSDSAPASAPWLCPPPTLNAVHAAVARLAPQANAILVEARAKRSAMAAQRLARKTAATAAAAASAAVIDKDTITSATGSSTPSDNISPEEGLGGEAKVVSAQRKRPRGRSPRRPARSPSPPPPPTDWRARVAKGMSFM